MVVFVRTTVSTKQPPAKAGGFKLSAESTDTGLKPVVDFQIKLKPIF
jgi:hypothetical protein